MPPAKPITAECFPTPALILRTNDPATRTYVGGAETPASRTMRQIGALAAARFARSPNVEVVSNRVTLPDGRVARGMRLLRGRAAYHAATEMVARIAAQGGDTSRIITDGDLIYTASAPETDRKTIFHSAMTLLAQDHATPTTALPGCGRCTCSIRRHAGNEATMPQSALFSSPPEHTCWTTRLRCCTTSTCAPTSEHRTSS